MSADNEEQKAIDSIASEDHTDANSSSAKIAAATRAPMMMAGVATAPVAQAPAHDDNLGGSDIPLTFPQRVGFYCMCTNETRATIQNSMSFVSDSFPDLRD